MCIEIERRTFSEPHEVNQALVYLIQDGYEILSMIPNDDDETLDLRLLRNDVVYLAIIEQHHEWVDLVMKGIE